MVKINFSVKDLLRRGRVRQSPRTLPAVKPKWLSPRPRPQPPKWLPPSQRPRPLPFTKAQAVKYKPKTLPSPVKTMARMKALQGKRKPTAMKVKAKIKKRRLVGATTFPRRRTLF